MGDPRELDTPPDEPYASDDQSTHAAEESELARVAEEWRRQTREGREQRKRHLEEIQKAHEPSTTDNTLRAVVDSLNCCSTSALMTLALVVLVATMARRMRG